MAAKQSRQTIKVFYAWQSDLPEKSNRRAIKRGLQLAGAQISEDLSNDTGTNVEIVIDEATRDLPGSPHIPTSILKKIQGADVFVADVSTINGRSPKASKKTPNPNVVFELGYAVGHLGWERVILLVNEAHGALTGLPFDFDRQRASPFKLGENGLGSQKDLTNLLTHAVKLILRKDPPRPRASQFDPVQAQRERDVTNLRWFLGSINLPVLDEHIALGAKYLTRASTELSDEANGILSSSSFHIYDEELRNSIVELVKHWHNSMKHDHYTPMIGYRAYIFTHGGPQDAKREDADWKYMDQERQQLSKALTSLLATIRDKFPEIDIREISKQTGARYNAQIEEIERRFTTPATARTSKKKKQKKQR